jgi:hypothetical protein
VFLAAFYMTGDAAQWFALVERNHGTPDWAIFVKLVNQRFGPPLRGNALGELIQLKRDTTVTDYQSRFLALMYRCTGLTEKQQIDIFTVDLCNPLKTDVELEHSETLEDAMALARAYEQRLVMTEDAPSRASGHFAPRPVGGTKPLALPAPPTTPTTGAPQLKRLTAAEMAAKRERDECYNCTEKFSRAHLDVCPMKGIFLIQMDEGPALDQFDDLSPLISLNAITGISAAETMRLAVRITMATLTTLVDSGSTHSFISMEAASRLHLLPIHRPGLRVKVVNDDQVACDGICKDTCFTIDDEEFMLDFFMIPLAGYDMVLGVHWLCTLGPILWDFTKARMSCWQDDHRVVWQGLPARRTPSVAHAMEPEHLMSALLEEFDDVFLPPTGLPPPRRLNHKIHLLPDTPPIAVRPYRYPQLVKDELEWQCEEMLQQGIIKSSSSAFSSPVLLIKKHDGSWRFCVDYRAVNAKTVCDMFPIPIMEELLDELRGTRFFTKLDLHSGYHQVRMDVADIHKIAFRIHHGHFEFLVMPFGLTNAPATFQVLMNDILQDFIRVFVLVFF